MWVSLQRGRRACAIERRVRAARLETLGSLLAVLLAASISACPSTTPTPARIERVQVVGDPTTPRFVLRLLGRGLALTGLTYDLSTSTGSAEVELRLVIVHEERSEEITVLGEQITVLSPRRLDAEVLQGPLAPGRYGVRLFAGAASEPIAEAADAFEVRDPSGEGSDGGVPLDGEPLDVDENAKTPDADVSNDAGPGGDATEGDAGDGDDAAEGDAGDGDDAAEGDAAPPDAGVRPDSGLGAFVGAFQFRREVLVGNASTGPAPAGTTLKVSIPHAELVARGQARADAADVVLYYGASALERQWEDAAKIGTDELVMIIEIPAEVPIGAVSGSTPLVLYFGDPNTQIAPTDAVYLFAEHFTSPLPGAWGVRDWYRCDLDRSINGTSPAPGAYCVEDQGSNPTRITLSSPNLSPLTDALPANQVYEISFWLNGLMVNQTNDLIYFAYGPSSSRFDNTTLLATSSYVEFPPNGQVSFDETNNAGRRTVQGWRFPTTRQWWTRARARFRTGVNAPSLHLRFISDDGNDNGATIVGVDDYAIRLALEPELEAVLGPIEIR